MIFFSFLVIIEDFCHQNFFSGNIISKIRFDNITIYYRGISTDDISSYNFIYLQVVIDKCKKNCKFTKTNVWEPKKYLSNITRTVQCRILSVHRMLRVLLLLLLRQVFTSSQSYICLAVRFGFVDCFICGWVNWSM